MFYRVCSGRKPSLAEGQLVNGNKSKLLIFSKNNSDISDPLVKINGDIIPRANNATNLGNILHKKGI